MSKTGQIDRVRGKPRPSGRGRIARTPNRGRPARVLLTFDEYKKISGGRTKIADLLAMPGVEDIELEIPQWRDLAQPADIS